MTPLSAIMMVLMRTPAVLGAMSPYRGEKGDENSRGRATATY
jgi:hypothetical protein